MAQEKARRSRATGEDGQADEPPKKTTRRAGKAEASAKPGAAAKPRRASGAKARPRVLAPGEGDVATLAYLMWERGEPGDAFEHWLRAERELAA